MGARVKVFLQHLDCEVEDPAARLSQYMEMTEAGPPEGQTLLKRLQHWTKIHPDKLLYTFLDDSGNETDRLTYKDTLSKAMAVSNGLMGTPPTAVAYSDATTGGKARGPYNLTEGDRVLLVYLPSLDFIVSFLACLMARLVPVPVFPPDPRRLKKDLYMFASIQRSSGAQVALTHTSYNHLKKVAEITSLFKTERASWPESLTWVNTDKLASKTTTAATPQTHDIPDAPAQDPCFLQYTSGSTSDPKGVVITHRSLTHNLSIITKELQTNQDTVEVSWLPQYHDMGLIGSYLGLLYCGGTGYFMSPFSFVRNPVQWPITMTKYRATHTQAPNFAYALTAKKYNAANPKPAINLSTVRHMINAAEPVDGPSVDAFTRTFGASGLPTDPPVVFPTYGLAEHTVFVCSGGRQRLLVDRAALENDQRVKVIDAGGNSEGDSHAREIVGCGYPKYDIEVVIAHPDTCTRLGAGEVGEIWVDSPSKASGYFNLPRETHEVFHARLREQGEGEEAVGGDNEQADGPSEPSTETTPADEGKLEHGGFLRTGDLGFLYDGELFVCGRIKDLVILRGRNLYPQDIEKAAERIAPELRPGCSAAFPLTNNEGEAEAIALIAEVRELSSEDVYRGIAEKVFTTLSKDDGVNVSVICLLKPRTVPKTTSGKIARKWCQKAMREGTLQVVHRWRAPDTESGGVGIEGGGAGDITVTNAVRKDDTTEAELEPLQPGQLETLPLDDIVQRLLVLASRTAVGSSGNYPSKDRALIPLMAMGMDSLASAQLKGAIEQYFNVTIPDELYFAENVSLKRIGVMLYAISKGRDPQQALTEYEADATSFEIEAGADFTAGKKGRFEWVLQTSPCWLCCPCCR